MGFYTVIQASQEQQDALLNKHMRPPVISFFNKLLGGKYETFIKSSFMYDSEDEIGFVTLTTWTGKKISYQMRGNTPCFVEFTGFGNIRYEIAYPSGDMLKILKDKGLEVKNNFWKGGEI
jgi:hypothetical protein